jgi:hypothetical protein
VKRLKIEYGKEFISNRIRDELILHNIVKYKAMEEQIRGDLKAFFYLELKHKNINKLSGGQRSIVYLVTLKHIILNKNITEIKLELINIKESLSPQSNLNLEKYLGDLLHD